MTASDKGQRRLQEGIMPIRIYVSSTAELPLGRFDLRAQEPMPLP